MVSDAISIIGDNTMKAAILLVTLLLCAGCPKVERSASQAFDNANEVIEHGEEKIWMEPGEGETDAEQEEFDNRY